MSTYDFLFNNLGGLGYRAALDVSGVLCGLFTDTSASLHGSVR